MRIPSFFTKPKFLKTITHIGALLPLAWMVQNYFTDNLTVNPIQELTFRTGRYALILLILSLAITPLNTLFGWRKLIPLRRLFGLYAFFYATLHFLIFVGLDYGFDWALLQEAIFEKRYALVGFSAFLILTALALTSNRRAMKRLGKRWKKLHRLSYLAGGLVICVAGKSRFDPPVDFWGSDGILPVIPIASPASLGSYHPRKNSPLAGVATGRNTTVNTPHISTKVEWHIAPGTPPPLSAAVVHVWRMWLAQPADAITALRQTLSADERERLARLRRPEARERFTITRGLLRATLAYHLCAVTRRHAVGIDGEFFRTIREREKFANRFFSENERAWLATAPPDEKPRVFFQIWTRKEAYLKACGDGVTRHLRGIDVSPAPADPFAIRQIADRPAEVDRWRVTTFVPAPKAIAALAVEGSDWQPSFWQGEEFTLK